MDLNPNGINLFLWLRSDCLVSTTQITLESVIHIRFRFWLLVCFFIICGSKSNADFFIFFFFDATWDRRGMRLYPRSVELLTSLWVEARQDCAQTGSAKKNIRGGENLWTWWNFWMLLHWTLSLCDPAASVCDSSPNTPLHWSSSCCFTKSNNCGMHSTSLHSSSAYSPKWNSKKKKKPHTQSVVLHVLVRFRWSHSYRSIDCNRLI